LRDDGFYMSFASDLLNDPEMSLSGRAAGFDALLRRQGEKKVPDLPNTPLSRAAFAQALLAFSDRSTPAPYYTLPLRMDPKQADIWLQPLRRAASTSEDKIALVETAGRFDTALARTIAAEAAAARGDYRQTVAGILAQTAQARPNERVLTRNLTAVVRNHPFNAVAAAAALGLEALEESSPRKAIMKLQPRLARRAAKIAPRSAFCKIDSTNLRAKARAMPFYEPAVLPDHSLAKRSWLTTGARASEGWLAGYSRPGSGGLVRYDNVSGDGRELFGNSVFGPQAVIAVHPTRRVPLGQTATRFWIFATALETGQSAIYPLTKRGKHQGEDIPMCGVPVHSAETYLQRLIKKGFRVAVCEQTESPAEAKKRGYKSVVRREIVRLVTPGTLTEDSLLDARGSNYILSLSRTTAGDHALAWADISTGGFWVCAVDPARLGSELSALSPREIVLAEALYQSADLMAGLPIEGAALTPVAGTKFDVRAGERRLKERFEVGSLDGYGAFTKAEISAAGALLDYLELTQAGSPVQLSPPRRREASGYLAIDPATRASLEIERTQHGRRQGSLLSVIDKTVTGAGARLLSDRLARPLVSVTDINARLDAVSFFIEQTQLRSTIIDALKSIGDMARAISRLALGRGGPRDLQLIGAALLAGETLSAAIAQQPSLQLPPQTQGAITPLSLTDKTALAALMRDIKKAFKDDVPMMARDGGFIRSGWHSGLDELKRLRDDSRRIVAGLQADYAKAADVPTLKIKHNNVLGYYIEVSPKYADTMLSKGAGGGARLCQARYTNGAGRLGRRCKSCQAHN